MKHTKTKTNEGEVLIMNGKKKKSKAMEAITKMIREELAKIKTENSKNIQEVDAPIFKRLNGLEYREINVSGGPETAKALEKLASKRGPKYAAGVYQGAVKGSYDTKYASAAYDEQFGNTTREYEAAVEELINIMDQERKSGADIKETKKPVHEYMDSLASYYTQAGKIGSGEYNLRNALEEIDDILNTLENPELKDSLMNAISDAIDMAYEMGVDEGIEQGGM